jgi:hypothetical protein
VIRLAAAAAIGAGVEGYVEGARIAMLLRGPVPLALLGYRPGILEIAGTRYGNA